MNRIELFLTDREVEQLRETADALPINPYGPLINKLLAALPFSESGAPAAPDSSPAAPVLPQETAGSFQLVARTQKGRDALPDLLKRILLTPYETNLPHGDSL